jgi:hypothetical protein
MKLSRRVNHLEQALPQSAHGTPVVLVIALPGGSGEPLVIGGSMQEYIAALQRLRGEEDPLHEEG